MSNNRPDQPQGHGDASRSTPGYDDILATADAAKLFAADANQIHMLAPPSEKPQANQEEIRQFFTVLGNFWADWTHIERSRFTHGNSAVWEGIAQGHHRETGKLVRLPIVFFLEFDNDGSVRESRVYVDVRSIGDQLQ